MPSASARGGEVARSGVGGLETAAAAAPTRTAARTQRSRRMVGGMSHASRGGAIYAVCVRSALRSRPNAGAVVASHPKARREVPIWQLVQDDLGSAVAAGKAAATAAAQAVAPVT
ncbi:hypothetical protein FGB62_167g06 [Gracilaria domingensis]|nr:hypothetical protein FGB62_167g06 [Gracilaria domingensis]